MQPGHGVVPRYAQLAAIIRADIISGRLKPGDRAPSEPELTLEFGVSKTTAARALGLLASEGLIDRRTGAGSFVSEGVPSLATIRVRPGTTVRARPAARDGDLPGVPVLIVEKPGRPAEEYPADRHVILVTR